MTAGKAAELLKIAVDKQIPRRPCGDLNSVPHYRCPSCKNGVCQYIDSAVFPYCHHCGQALDWDAAGVAHPWVEPWMMEPALWDSEG